MTALDAWTLAIAVAGFLLAGLDFAWSVYRDLLDRHKVSVIVQESRLYPLGGPLSDTDPDPVVIITATNAGRRAVTVTGFHFKEANSPEHGFLIHDPTDALGRCFDATPKELQEGQTARQCIPSKNLQNIEIEHFYVTDTLNRQWKSKAFPLRRAGPATPTGPSAT